MNFSSVCVIDNMRDMALSYESKQNVGVPLNHAEKKISAPAKDVCYFGTCLLFFMSC